MHVVRAAIPGVNDPAANAARFFELLLDGDPHLVCQPARILRHSSGGLEFMPRHGQLPPSAEIHPATTIARQPGAISRPS
jgi:hypothetical protein